MIRTLRVVSVKSLPPLFGRGCHVVKAVAERDPAETDEPVPPPVDVLTVELPADLARQFVGRRVRLSIEIEDPE